MLDLAHRDGARFLLMSTSEIYGDPSPDAIPTPETYRGLVSCTGPRACYDESKRLAETLLAVYAQKHGVEGCALRPFNFYGPGQRLDDQRIVPDLMSAVLARRPISLFSDGRATRSLCYASDAITGLMLVWLKGRPGEAYNIGNDAEISIGDLARLAAGLATPALPVELAVSKDADYLTDNPNRRCPDLSKARRELGYDATIGRTRPHLALLRPGLSGLTACRRRRWRCRRCRNRRSATRSPGRNPPPDMCRAAASRSASPPSRRWERRPAPAGPRPSTGRTNSRCR
jgi:dTDP-glucose 4,6-dehydratase/UDP-glucuronate decarboxylase